MIIIISLQPILPSDNDFLLKVFKECRTDLAFISGMNEEQKSNIIRQQFVIEQYQLKQTYPEAELNLVMFNGQPVGRLYINYGKNEDRIIAIGLLESYRFLGIGKKIMISVIETAAEKGKAVSLQVAWFNKSAYAFYEKLGFKVVEDNGVMYEMKYTP
ncbi:MAG: GNAT family N-acetyltransferase [Bacillota bacterium]|nr:GNAT family N-acetyltransferase [Bacillota bacterium]